MRWFRTHQAVLLRLALAFWLLAFGVAVGQGCLSQAGHDRAAAHDILTSTAPGDDHAQHANGCLQYCEDSSVALNPAQSLPTFDLPLWMLLPLALLSLNLGSPAGPALFAWRRPPLPRPPARLSFVRFND